MSDAVSDAVSDVVTDAMTEAVPSQAADPGGRRLPLLAAASAAVALAAADTYVVVLALTDMMAGVGLGIEALQAATPIVSGFLLGYIAMLPLLGRLADLLGRRRVLLGCLIVFAAGSLVTALAVELPVLVAGRVLQGVGGGGLVPATLALVADLWPPQRRGAPLGAVGALQELGSVLGPVLGAVILAVAGWRAIFWANLAVALVLYALIALLDRPAGQRRGGRRPLAGLGTLLVAVAGAALGVLALAAPERLVTDVTLGAPFVPLAGQSRALTPIGLASLGVLALVAAVTAPRWWPVLRRADLAGAALVALGLGAVVLTFASSDPEREVVGPLGLRLLPVAALAFTAYGWWHRRAPEPLVPRGVVRGRGRRALVVSLLVGVALVAVLVDVPLLARLTGAYDETGAALVLVRFLVAVPAGALLGGVALHRLGDAAVAAPGLLLVAAGLFAMSRWDLRSVEDTVPATVALAAVGLGVGLAFAPVNNAALADSPEQAHGVVSSLVVVARMVGMVLGLALLTSVGLARYFEAVRRLSDPRDPAALLAAGVVQVQSVFLGAAVAALLGAALAATLGWARGPVTAAAGPASRPGRRP